MVYLPTKLDSLGGFDVGKYTSPIELLGLCSLLYLDGCFQKYGYPKMDGL